MSRVLRRKHVLKEMMEDDYELPTAEQMIVRVVSSHGNNLHEVETSDAATERFLVSMPNKYRNNIFVKRGDFVLVVPIVEGKKVKAEICKILTPEHVKEYTKAGIWPKQFTKKRELEEDADYGEDEDSMDEAFVVRNRNRPKVDINDESDDTESSSDE